MEDSESGMLCSMRFGIAILAFFGFFIANAQRTSIGVAVVCMVNQTYLESQTPSMIVDNNTGASIDSDTCGKEELDYNNSTTTREGEFEWSKEQIGLILGAFFWGYMVSQIPGGWLAGRIGGAKVLGGFLLLMAVSTVLMPFAARLNIWLLMVLRIISGIGGGVSYPAMHAIWGQWSPPSERSRLAGISYAGASLGNVVALPLTGLLCEHGFDGGWPSAFYILGSLGILWSILWLVVVADKPETAKFISQNEREYILNSLKGQTEQNQKEHRSIPWKSMLLSMPVWAIVVGNLCGDMAFYIFETCQPSYLKEVLKFDITSNGFFGALPYLLFWVVVLTVGFFADVVRRAKLSTKNTRKLCDATGKFTAATMLIILGFLDCTLWPLAMTVLVIGIGSLGFQWSGYLVNHVDIAPQYAGILMGISNCIACLSGIIGPLMVNVVTKDQSRQSWQIVFGLVAVVLVAGEIFYLIFADGEIQSWAKTSGVSERTDGDVEEKETMLNDKPHETNGTTAVV